MRAADCTRGASRARDPNRRDARGGARGVVNVDARKVDSQSDRCVVVEEVPLRWMQRGVFVGEPGDFAGNDSRRSGDCHAMFVSVMSRKRARC